MGGVSFERACFGRAVFGRWPVWCSLVGSLQFFVARLIRLEIFGSFIRESKGSCTLSVKVIPRSSRNQVVGVEQGVLKIKLTAPPVEGAANEALVEFLADIFKKPKKSVSLLSGQQSRHKVVRISELKSSEILEVLNQ